MLKTLARSSLKLRWLVYIVWLAFVLRGLFYCSAFPIFEGFDEYVHFGVIQRVFFHHEIANPRAADYSREIAESLKLVPVPWLLRDDAMGRLSHEAYWRLAPSDRLDRQMRLRTLPPSWASADAQPSWQLYEAQQPPLFHWIILPVYASVKSFDLPTRVWVLRCASLLLASTIIPIAFATAKRFFFDQRGALGVAIVVASMPQLAVDAFRISNEDLSIPMGGLAIFAVLTLWKSPPNLPRGILVGLVLSAALLTKAYFLALLPWAAFVLIGVLLRDPQHRRTAAWQMVAVLTTCLAASGWFYWRALSLTGTVTGEMNDVAAQTSRLSITGAIRIMPWRRILDFVAGTHIWLGNWSFLVVRTWMYRAIELVFVLAMSGLVLHFVRPRKSLPERTSLCVLIMPYVFLLLGALFQAVQGFRSAGNIGTMGYYLFALIVPEAIVLLAGLFRLLPDIYSLFFVPVLALFFNLLEQFGTTFLLLPYYAGIIQHDGSGHLPALKISQLAHGGISRLFDNLLANKPAFLTSWELMFMMALSFGAAVALVSIGCLVAVRSRNRPAV